MATNYKGQIGTEVPVQMKPIVLNDGVDFTFDKKAAGDMIFARGFIPDRDGTMSVIEGGGAILAIPVLKGVSVKGVVKRFRSTGTTVGMTGVAQG